MAVPTVTLRPVSTFVGTSPQIAGVTFFGTPPIATDFWDFVDNEWGQVDGGVPTALSSNYKQNQGGQFAARLTPVVDKIGNLTRPYDLENHVLRAQFRNRQSDYSAKITIGLARAGTAIQSQNYTPTSSAWQYVELPIAAANIAALMGTPGEGGADTNYASLRLFFTFPNTNANQQPTPPTPAWLFDVSSLELVIPDPTHDRATRHFVSALVSSTRLQVTSHRASVLVKGPTYSKATQHQVSALVKNLVANATRHGASALVKTRALIATAHRASALVKVRQTLLATSHKASVLVKVPQTGARATVHKASVLTKVLVSNATRHRASVLVKRQGVNATRHWVSALVKRGASSPASATRHGAAALVKLPYTRDSVAPLSFPSVNANLLNADWGVEIALESSYSTDVSRSGYTVAEERRGLIDRPYRRFSLRLVGHGSERVLQTTMNLARQGHTRTVLPLYMDASTVRRHLAPDFLGCPVLYRRFFRGQRIVVHGWSDNYPASPEYAVIRTVNAEGLELASPLAGSFAKGARIYPLIDAETILENRIGALSDDVSHATLTFHEVIGKSAMPAIAAGSPAEPHHFDGYPILELSPDWASGVESRIVRYGSQASSGRGLVTDLAGERPVFAHEIPLVFTERAHFWRVLSFFDTRMGRLNAFWTIWPSSLFTPVAVVNSTTIDLRASGNLSDVQLFLRHLAIVRRDGRASIHRIESMIVNGAEWRVTVTEPLQVGGVSEIRKATAAVFGRLTSDSFVESWATGTAARGSLDVIELLEEKAVVIPDVVEGITSAGPDAVAGLFAWFDSGTGTHSSPNDMASATILRTKKASLGDVVSAWDDVRTPLGGLPAFAGAALVADRPKLMQFDSADLNNNRRSLRFDAGPRWFRLRTSDASEDAAPFWDDTPTNFGFTIFMNLRLTAEDTLERKLLWRSGIVEWTSKTVTLYETDGGGPVTLTLPPGWAKESGLRTLALVWRPNDYIRLYRNGGAPIVQETASKILDLDPIARVTEVCRFAGTPTAESDEFAIGSDPFVNSIIFYKRALGNASLNGVGNFLASMFATPWASVI